MVEVEDLFDSLDSAKKFKLSRRPDLRPGWASSNEHKDRKKTTMRIDENVSNSFCRLYRYSVLEPMD